MSRKIWIAFVAVQSVGLICAWIWTYDIFGLGPDMWTVAFFVLFPGNALSGLIVEKVFWDTGLTLKQMLIIDIPLEIAINACVWLLFVKSIGIIKRVTKRGTIPIE